jgi:peptidylprolyl isomerase
MAKPEKNRAQRRMDKRRSVTHQQSFWTTTQGKVTVGVAGAAIVAFVLYSLWFKTPTRVPPTTPPATTSTTTTHTPKPVQPPSSPADPNAKLESKDLKVGTGREAKSGDLVTVHYTGTLTNGTKFDSSVDKGQPYTFVLGTGTVIQGWDQGLVGMKEGGRRQLVIPPSLGYGSQDKGKIPPNSTLKFDVEMVKVESAGAAK